MIKMNNVRFGYNRKRTLFDGLSLELPKGSIVGLLGRNGEGKSTLMKLISGQLIAQGEKIQTLGFPTEKRHVEMLQQIYMLPEDLLLPRITLRRYFDIIAPFYPNYDADLADELVRVFELNWDWNLAKISLGQRKKSAITLAFSVRTPILLLDEPTNGLDIPSKSIFRQMLAKYIGDDQTVIISTHQVRDLEQLIDRIVLLDGNHIVCNETIANLSEQYRFGAVTPETAQTAIYREPSVMGEYGMWHLDEGAEPSDFSMELFFNAVVSKSIK